MVQVGDHKEILGPGDTIYFDSNTPHGENTAPSNYYIQVFKNVNSF